MACRVIANLLKVDHVTPTMSSLHWLRNRECINYKTACLMHGYQHGNAPTYLKGLLPKMQNTRRLRSSTSFVNQSSANCHRHTSHHSHLQVLKFGTLYHPIFMMRWMLTSLKRISKHICLGNIMDKHFSTTFTLTY